MSLNKRRVCLIEVWLGKIPDYFKYHAKTLSQVSCADFYFFTNDLDYDFSKVSSDNLHVIYISEVEFLQKINAVSPIKINQIQDPRKITDFKLLYFEAFKELTEGYTHVGAYDIDTLFGRINQTLIESLDHYDFISVGDSVYCDRLSGPLLIMRNDESVLSQLRSDRYYESLLMEEVYGYGEKELSDIAKSSYRTKIIYSTNVETNNSGKITYDCLWKNGKIESCENEIQLYHFYRKDKTKFTQAADGSIIAGYNKKMVDDFSWVTYVTENYLPTTLGLMRSVKAYSNRKLIIYTINFDWTLPAEFQASGQFEARRFNIERGTLGAGGRDNNVLSCKPVVMLDSIKAADWAGNRTQPFVYVDSDISLIASADQVVNQHIRNLTFHPLINSHVHDTMYYSNPSIGVSMLDTIELLLSEMQCDVEKIRPRRKANVVLYDWRSAWFFQEQLDVYFKYRNAKPGILALHDEDSANALLAKYNLTNCLPVVDIEQCTNINLEISDSYSFSISAISPEVVLPNGPNDLIAFHALKRDAEFIAVEQDYGQSVISCEELVVRYSNQCLQFEKNSHMTKKTFKDLVNFTIKSIDGRVKHSLDNQEIRKYWLFYISDLQLEPGDYIIQICETDGGRIIFNDMLTV